MLLFSCASFFFAFVLFLGAAGWVNMMLEALNIRRLSVENLLGGMGVCIGQKQIGLLTVIFR